MFKGLCWLDVVYLYCKYPTVGGILIVLTTTLWVVYLYCRYSVVGGILIYCKYPTVGGILILQVPHCGSYTYIVSAHL